MLSFTRGKPVAIALDKNDKIVFTIHVTPEEEEADISADNLLELIDDIDISMLRAQMRLGTIEMKMVRQALNQGDVKKLNLNDKLERAIELLKEIATDKLKKEIDFSKDKDIKRVIPLIGARDTAYDRSICCFGPSEAGKSWLVKEICKFDKRKRPVIVFSKIIDDVSLRELKKLRTACDKKTRLIQIPLLTEKDLFDLPTNTDLKDCIVLFDDIDSFPKEMSDFLREYRDSILESGRHNNITVISTSHLLRNYGKTKTILNEAELICLFPSANKFHATMFLKDRFGLEKQESNFFINKAMKTGRMLCMRMSAPNMVIHSKGVIMM